MMISACDPADVASVPLILVRHGRTAWNDDGRYQGRSDPPLAPVGVAEAVAVAECLRGEEVSAIVASPLGRARATARVIAEGLGVTRIGIDRRLIEIAYGAWEGLRQSDIRARWPDQLRSWKREPAAMLFPSGESLAQLRARVRDFIRDAAGSRCRGAGSLLAVTHAGPIRIVTLEARERPLGEFRRIEVGPGSISRFMLLRKLGDPFGLPRIREG